MEPVVLACWMGDAWGDAWRWEVHLYRPRVILAIHWSDSLNSAKASRQWPFLPILLADEKKGNKTMFLMVY